MSTELDRQVAEKIMDGISCRTCRIGYCQAQFTCPRHGFNAWTRYYSGDIATSFEVVERMHEKGFLMDLGHHIDLTWRCKFTDCRTLGEAKAIAPTAPEAICRAALAAVDAVQGS